jgi:hypothetical protein
LSARIAVHRKPGILPFDFDEEIGHIHLLAVDDLGDIQHAEPHCYYIGIAAGVGPRACQVNVWRPGLRMGDYTTKNKEQGKENSFHHYNQSGTLTYSHCR